MHYLDFISLYPSINYDTEYPVGAPTTHFLNVEVNWGSEEEFKNGMKEQGLIHCQKPLDARGLFKIEVEPCHGSILFPPLPYRYENS